MWISWTLLTERVSNFPSIASADTVVNLDWIVMSSTNVYTTELLESVTVVSNAFNLKDWPFPNLLPL